MTVISITVQTSNLKNMTSQAIQLFNHHIAVITVFGKTVKYDVQMTLHKHTKTHLKFGSCECIRKHMKI